MTSGRNSSAPDPSFDADVPQARAAPAAAGNNLIVDRLVETPAWLNMLLGLLPPIDVYFVGIHCALMELDSTSSAESDAATLMPAWTKRCESLAFKCMEAIG